LKGVILGIAIFLVMFVELGIYLPAYGVTTTIFADDFSGTQLSSQWTVSTSQTDSANPATGRLANGLLTLNSTGPLRNGLDVGVPFVPTGDNLSVTARVKANVFGRFHMVLLTQAGTFDQSFDAAAFEFDMTGTVPPNCGGGASIERIGNSYSIFSCNASVGIWYQLQMVVTDNPYSVSWNYLNDSGAVIATTSLTSAAFSLSSIKELALGVWTNSVESTHSLYEVDWVIASSPSPSPVHAGSSGSTVLTANPRSTSTTVSCNPASIQAGQTTTCSATVTDTAAGTPSAPTGDVSWKSSGSGSFSATTCTLSGTGASASCSISYTPNASGSQVITASYGGDTIQPASTQPTTLVVTGNFLNGSLMLAGLIGGVGAAGIGIGAAVTLLVKRRKPRG